MNNFRVFSYVTATKKKENEPSRSNDNAHVRQENHWKSFFFIFIASKIYTFARNKERVIINQLSQVNKRLSPPPGDYLEFFPRYPSRV